MDSTGCWKKIPTYFMLLCSCQFIFVSAKGNTQRSVPTSLLVDSPPFHYVTPETFEADVPILLWWTGRLFADTGLKQLVCPKHSCYSTGDRKYFHDPRTYGFYFYGTDLDPEDMPIPRKPHHEWALYHEESPMNNYMLVHNTMLQLFNHTATFRRESDYPLTTNAIPSLQYLMERSPESIETKNKARKQGLAPVLFVQSHCNIASDRERYVLELMKHIDVDSIGACLHNKDMPEEISQPVESMDSPEFFDLIAKYKFHLSFENAICKDYQTEKLFRPLHVGSVPVYRGSPLARDWMPNNNTIIMADDFESPKELAEFLKQLDKNDEEYEKYVQYKYDGIGNDNLLKYMNSREWGLNDFSKPDSLVAFACHICEKITVRYRVERQHRNNPDVPLIPRKYANATHLNCPQPYPSVGDLNDVPSDDEWRNQYWIEDYWGGLEKAQALIEMIESDEKDPKAFMSYWDRIARRQPFNSNMMFHDEL